MRALFVLPIFFIIISLILAVYIMIGVYVYRDAGKRGMNKVLWTLVAVFVPSFLGLVAYLVVRNNSILSSRCPQCQQAVHQDYAICPNCGYELLQNCESCGKAVSKDWKICPWCRHELSYTNELNDPFAQPVKSNKGLITTIVAVVAVLFIVFIGLMVVLPYINYGNVQIMSSETNSINGFSQKYDYFTGTKKRSIHIPSGQTAEIKVNTMIEKGELVVEITNFDGEIIKTISDSGYDTTTINAELDETYWVKITGKKTTGSYSVNWDIQQ